MTYKTHITAGLLAGGFILSKLVDPQIYLLSASFLGSIILDIDEPKSYIGRRTKILSHILKFVLKHRGLIHSFLGAFLLSSILSGIVYNYGLNKGLILFFIIGCLTHLILDLFSDEGVPLFYPFIKKRYKIKIFKTGGFLEKIFRLGLYFVGIYLVFY